MIGKAVLLLLVATVAVQSYVPYDSYEDVAFFEANADSLIEQIKKFIEQTIATAKQTLEKIINDLSTRIKEIIEKAKATLDKDLKALLDEIKKIKEEAKKMKVDITECVKDHEEELKNLPKKYADKIVHCTDDVLNKGKAVADDAKKSVEESFQAIRSLIDEFKKCGTGLDGLKCKGQVSLKITRAVLEIPRKISKILGAATPEILGLLPEAQKCVLKQTHDYAAEGRKIFTEIKTCVDHKLHPTA